MFHDLNFHAGQAYPGMPVGINPDFDLWRLHHHDIGDPIRIASLPAEIRRGMGWGTGAVYLCPKVLQRHIRNHEHHPMPFELVRWIPWIIEHGTAINDRGSSVVFFMRIPALHTAFLCVVVRMHGSRACLWIDSFGFRNAKQYRKKQKFGRVLRP